MRASADCRPSVVTSPGTSVLTTVAALATVLTTAASLATGSFLSAGRSLMWSSSATASDPATLLVVSTLHNGGAPPGGSTGGKASTRNTWLSATFSEAVELTGVKCALAEGSTCSRTRLPETPTGC